MSDTRRLPFLLLALLALAPAAHAQKVKTLVSILGSESLHAEGVGIVTGLAGSGDKSAGAQRMLKDYLERHQYALESADLGSGNIALVRVDATIPPFSRAGEKIPVRVSAMNGAGSLENGILLHCALRLRPDGEVVAWANGRVVIGSGAADGQHPTSGQIAAGPDSGAQIVRAEAFAAEFVRPDLTVRLNLNRKSFADAAAIAAAINGSESTNPFLQRLAWGAASAGENARVAHALDAGQVVVRIPDPMNDKKVEYVSQVLELDVAVERPARVLLNRQTRTVVITGDVKLDPVAISHRNLSVTLEAADPNGPAARGYRLKDDDKRSLVEMDGPGRMPNLQSLVNTLNAMGVMTDDVIVILEKLKSTGSLHAELIVE